MREWLKGKGTILIESVGILKRLHLSWVLKCWMGLPLGKEVREECVLSGQSTSKHICNPWSNMSGVEHITVLPGAVVIKFWNEITLGWYFWHGDCTTLQKTSNFLLQMKSSQMCLPLKWICVWKSNKMMQKSNFGNSMPYSQLHLYLIFLMCMISVVISIHA
jgi:hypothetical protein